jgi:DNA-binding CsgD family transcriptional regulator
MQSVTDMGAQIYANPRDRDETMRLLRERGHLDNYEVKLRHKDGHCLWGLLNIRIVRDENGDILCFETSSSDITVRKQLEEELAEYREGLERLVTERTQELKDKTATLEETNVALKILLQHRDADMKELEERFVMNIGKLVLPFAEKLKGTILDDRQAAFLNIIETNLSGISSSMTKKFAQFNFTPTEVEVASMIKEGRSTKEIARIIGIATSSVSTHRNNIRKKLGISKENINLRSHLHSVG